jgi:hypothetical protein
MPFLLNLSRIKGLYMLAASGNGAGPPEDEQVMLETCTGP